MKAIVTGAQGQDGSILINKLIKSGHQVVGIGRRRLDDFSARDKSLSKLLESKDSNFIYKICDLRDSTTVLELLNKETPDVIFNLAAMSSPAESWNNPAGTLSNDTHSVVNLLDSIRLLSPKTKMIQANTAAIFHSTDLPINEESPIKITNPYAAAKYAALTISQQYKERYGVNVSNAIMFNHESIWRPDAFVTRKITKSIARIAAGKQEKLKLWTVKPVRDFGWAEEFMDAMILMANLDSPSDVILATGIGVSIEEFVDYCFDFANLDPSGRIEIDVDGLNTGIDISIGNPSKAGSLLGWRALTSWKGVAEKMVAHDLILEGVAGS